MVDIQSSQDSALSFSSIDRALSVASQYDVSSVSEAVDQSTGAKIREDLRLRYREVTNKANLQIEKTIDSISSIAQHTISFVDHSLAFDRITSLTNELQNSGPNQWSAKLQSLVAEGLSRVKGSGSNANAIENFSRLQEFTGALLKKLLAKQEGIEAKSTQVLDTLKEEVAQLESQIVYFYLSYFGASLPEPAQKESGRKLSKADQTFIGLQQQCKKFHRFLSNASLPLSDNKKQVLGTRINQISKASRNFIVASKEHKFGTSTFQRSLIFKSELPVEAVAEAQAEKLQKYRSEFLLSLEGKIYLAFNLQMESFKNPRVPHAEEEGFSDTKFRRRATRERDDLLLSLLGEGHEADAILTTLQKMIENEPNPSGTAKAAVAKLSDRLVELGTRFDENFDRLVNAVYLKERVARSIAARVSKANIDKMIEAFDQANVSLSRVASYKPDIFLLTGHKHSQYLSALKRVDELLQGLSPNVQDAARSTLHYFGSTNSLESLSLKLKGFAKSPEAATELEDDLLFNSVVSDLERIFIDESKQEIESLSKLVFFGFFRADKDASKELWIEVPELRDNLNSSIGHSGNNQRLGELLVKLSATPIIISNDKRGKKPGKGRYRVNSQSSIPSVDRLSEVFKVRFDEYSAKAVEASSSKDSGSPADKEPELATSKETDKPVSAADKSEAKVLRSTISKLSKLEEALERFGELHGTIVPNISEYLRAEKELHDLDSKRTSVEASVLAKSANVAAGLGRKRSPHHDTEQKVLTQLNVTPGGGMSTRAKKKAIAKALDPIIDQEKKLAKAKLQRLERFFQSHVEILVSFSSPALNEHFDSTLVSKAKSRLAPFTQNPKKNARNSKKSKSTRKATVFKTSDITAVFSELPLSELESLKDLSVELTNACRQVKQELSKRVDLLMGQPT